MFFRKRKVNLDDVFIAAPCPIQWSEMEGTEQVRFCSHCRLNVYNISEMTGKEAQELIAGHSGQLCLQLFRRTDGTLMTRDCPIGKRIADAVRQRARVAALTFLALFNAPAVLANDSKDAKSTMLGTQIGGLMGISKLSHYDQMRQDAQQREEAKIQRRELNTEAMEFVQTAQKYEGQGEPDQASEAYAQALSVFQRHPFRHDRAFASKVAKQYARLLKKQKRTAEAQLIEKEFCLKK